MIRPLLVFCVLLGLSESALAGPPAPLTLTLPNADAYSYWVQSQAGSVTALPVNVSGKSAVKTTSAKIGDHIVVLDAHTGQIASQEVARGAGGSPAPLAFSMKDFRALDVPVAPIPAPALSPAPAPAKSREAEPERGDSARRLLTGTISLALAGGVVWLLVHLVRTRGEPLLHLARRAGVEVPDPTAHGPEQVESTVIYTPVRRTPDKIPEEAGVSVTTPMPKAQRGQEFPLADTPSLVGIQGLAAGGTFGLTGGDVTVGRDGENEIVLAENTVSRYHARIAETGAGQYTLSDLESANGVYVNGTRVQRAILAHGDEVKIGDNYFRFQAAKESL